jgi:exopolysaccharide biosynthesis polyprenyl glycosylphosphotransferase
MKTSLQIKTKLALLTGDLVLLTISLALGTYVRLGDAWFSFEENSLATALYLMGYPLSLYLTRAYEVQPEASSAESLRRPLLGLLFAATVTSFFFYFAPTYRYARGIFAITNVLFALFMVVWRLWFFLRLRRRSLSVLIMGNPTEAETARQLIQEFSASSRIRTWFPGPDPPGAPAKLEPNGAPGATEDFDLLILAGESLDPATIRKAAAFRLQGVLVWDLPRLFTEFAERLPAQYLDERWLATAEGFHSLNEQSFQVIKRLVDITLALGGLILASPLLLVAAVLIKLQDGGAVIYSQERVGQRGETFRVHKLRTMVGNAEEDTGPVWASPGDPRVTRIGRWLRKLRIDEIPQTWNVLKGEMSFVGPRPERPVFVAALQRKYGVYALRHLLRPGITGWAQICCPYAASEEDTLLKLEYDLYYLQNASLLFDLRIILKTISIVISVWGSR